MSYDQSHLDKKYFIDRHKYNCPFCNRKSVTYTVTDVYDTDWSNDTVVRVFIVQCGSDSCNKRSLHFTKKKIETSDECFWRITVDGEYKYFSKEHIDIDNLFFYHQPTTFFTLDERVNQSIRKIISEAEGCAKMNYLIGGSGCLRKAIYKILSFEDIPEVGEGESKLTYSDRIKLLKAKHYLVPSEYFDVLSNIQDMTSKQLHEGLWEPWKQSEFDYLLRIVKEILTEMYVTPAKRIETLTEVLKLSPPEEVLNQEKKD